MRGVKTRSMLIHPISPVFDKDSRVLILGSFPSVKSRETGFFYGHALKRVKAKAWCIEVKKSQNGHILFIWVSGSQKGPVYC